MRDQEIVGLMEAYSSIYSQSEDCDIVSEARAMSHSVDIFDVILEHLVAEGFADTEEAALAIMANMSEEWKQSIVEEVGIVGPPKKAIDAIPGVRNARIAAANAVKRSDYGLNDEVKKVGKHVVPSGRLGGQFDRPGGTKYKDISGDK